MFTISQGSRIALTFLSLSVGLASAPSGASACERICPQYLTKYCVEGPGGRVFATMTNPCFACQRDLKILYRGACRGSR
jgi:hypothetical protein